MFHKLKRRTPLTLKMVILSVAVGIVVWLVADHFVTRAARKMFEAHLQDMLRQQSQEDRLRFDHYLKSFGQIARLTAGSEAFIDYLDERDWFAGPAGEPSVHRTFPSWFLGRAALRVLAVPRFAVLLDGKKRVREIVGTSSGRIPDFSSLSPLVLSKSRGQVHLTFLDGFPYALTAGTVNGEEGRQATLLLASPIDDTFLLDSQGDFPKRLVGLISADETRIVASNNSELLPPGTLLKELEEDYLITGRQYHDYGGAEVPVHFASFIPRHQLKTMTASFVEQGRRLRSITAAVFILALTLVMLWVTHRIRILTRQVGEFSQQALGGEAHSLPPGDKLDILAERFQLLTEEVIASHRTIQREAEEAAQRQLELERRGRRLALLQSVTETMEVGVLVDTGERLRPVNDLMRAFAEQFGGASIFEIDRGESRERTLVDSAGRERIFRLISPEYFREEKVVLVNEITEQKRAEAEKEKLQQDLYQAQRMEAVGRLAGGVAHDFNNILTAINGYAHLVLMKMPGDDPLRDKVQTISEAGERAAELTKQLLAFSRRQIMSPAVVNLNRAIEEIRKILTRLIGEDIRIEYSLAEGLWNVVADVTQIEQIIMNLAINARDAMPDGGELIIETENVVMDENYVNVHPGTKPGEYVRFSISDTGQGIPAGELPHIFEPFYTTKEMGKGTGLGLATVYGIIKQNKGNIYVYSEPDRGTTFKIYLPRVKAEATTPLELSGEETVIPGGTETILLVEDEREIRNLGVTILSDLGYTVIEAADGEEAEQVFSRYHGRIDLLLTDVVLPRKSGRHLADSLRKPHPEIKVLYMSGYTENTIAHHGVLEPGINFLQKPIVPNVLAMAVRKVLDSGRV